MKKYEIIFGIIKIPLDFIMVFWSFYIARDLRQLGDFIPGINLPYKTISDENLFFFGIYGAIFLVIIFFIHSLYSLKITSSKIKEVLKIMQYSIYSFIFFSVFVYFSKDFLYTGFEIPRLVILFSLLITIFLLIVLRLLLNKVLSFLINIGFLSKRKIVLITTKKSNNIKEIINDIKNTGVYDIIGYINTKKITNTDLKYLGGIKNIKSIFKNIDEILFIDSSFNKDELYEIWEYSRIYGIRYRYITNSFDLTNLNTKLTLLNNISVIEIKNTSLDAWGRVIKRLFDLFFSLFALVLLFPVFILIGILIKLEDPKGPIVYKNRRVGQNGKLFNLYKFRYIKWKYCIKDSYGVSKKDDEALKVEKELIKKQTSREGPLYKIKNDPRKTKIGTYLEKYSIDEFPQFINVFLGNMSLIGPRPHQPREVEKYKDHEKRVLNIKPGITGMAQVDGREKNDFEREVRLDIFYIENWSLLLDMKIFFKTILVVLFRK